MDHTQSEESIFCFWSSPSSLLDASVAIGERAFHCAQVPALLVWPPERVCVRERSVGAAAGASRQQNYFVNLLQSLA